MGLGCERARIKTHMEVSSCFILSTLSVLSRSVFPRRPNSHSTSGLFAIPPMASSSSDILTAHTYRVFAQGAPGGQKTTQTAAAAACCHKKHPRHLAATSTHAPPHSSSPYRQYE